jgi:hypothetical protein
MTYGSTVSGMEEQRGKNRIPFVREPKAEWFTKERSLLVGIAVEPSEQTFPLPKFASASSIAYPEIIPVWQQPGPSLVRASELEFRSIEQLYILRRRAEVIGFLKAYPFLVPLLLEAYGKIAQHFGPSPVFLEVVTDPEAIDDRQLVAFIRTDLDPIEALASLDRFDKSWWLEASHRSQGKLCIHLE